jgi:hypothetical protein
MQRSLSISCLCALMTIAFTQIGSASRPHGVGAGPEITSVQWLNEPEVGEEALLEIWSVDERGVIAEVMIDWGDGSFDFAHTYCLQGPERGLPHRMVLGHEYQEPGEYTITIVAVSKPSCFAPNGSSRFSEEVLLDVGVMP